jgi:23S rRNA (cytosine1962-C5)-methyltransferase
VFNELRVLRRIRVERFDLIILDPPKFAPSAAHAERAARAYRDINASAFACSIPVAC